MDNITILSARVMSIPGNSSLHGINELMKLTAEPGIISRIMTIFIDAHFDFTLPQLTDVALQFEAAALPEQQLIRCNTRLSPREYFARIPAEDNIGERIMLSADGFFSVDYSAEVEIDRITAPLGSLEALQPHELPGEVFSYLMDSRYCQADRFHSFVDDEFGATTGGARVLAIRDWIAEHFAYEPGSSTPETTAMDSFIERRGICRDYAHVLVTLARASTIPARFVSCFSPGVEPPDFHAVAEVFLADPTVAGGGAWHLVDATGMATPGDIVKIGVGRDAADVSFLTTFGDSQFGDKTVAVSQT